jgi:hypothetical protein
VKIDRKLSLSLNSVPEQGHRSGEKVLPRAFARGLEDRISRVDSALRCGFTRGFTP